MVGNGRTRLPRTREAQVKLLSDAACAGYMAGFNDRVGGQRVMEKAMQRNTRIKIRAEIERWMGK